MDCEQLRKRWEEVLRRKYPGVILRRGTNPDGEYEYMPWFIVYLVPDEQEPYFFSEWYMEERRPIMEREGIPDAEFMPHSVSTTRAFYPEIWHEAQAEKRAAKATTKTPRKNVRAPRTSAVPKTAAVR